MMADKLCAQVVSAGICRKGFQNGWFSRPLPAIHVALPSVNIAQDSKSRAGRVTIAERCGCSSMVEL
jgi:hypothetical protein